jgi:hypothetical protein
MFKIKAASEAYGLSPKSFSTRLLFTDPGWGEVPRRHFWDPVCLPTHPLPHPGGRHFVPKSEKLCQGTQASPPGLIFSLMKPGFNTQRLHTQNN